MHRAVHSCCMHFRVRRALSDHLGVWNLKIREEIFLPKVTQLGSQGAGWVRSLRTDVSKGYDSVSSMGLISGGPCQLITLVPSATLAIHRSRSLWARTFLCPLFRQNSFQNLSNFAPGDTLHGAPGS